MKNWTIGKRIVTGFACLILIAIALGGVAVWKMTGVKTIAGTLSGQYMPATKVANSVEREALQTMYELRGYVFTDNTNYLAKGLTNLADVKQHLNEAKALAAKPGNDKLGFLQQAAAKADNKVLEYEEMIKQTVALTDAMDKDRTAMNAAAAAFVKACDDFGASQRALLGEALKATNSAGGLEVADLQRKIQNISQQDDIMDVGNSIRIGNFKAQATRDPQLFRDTQKKFDELETKFDSLKANTKVEVNRQHIENCRLAAHAYQDAMASFLTHWQAREDLNTKRGLVATAVLEAAQDTSVGSLDSSTKGSGVASSSLTTASWTMVVGLMIATVVGITLAYFISRVITTTLKRISNAIDDGANQVASASGQVSGSSQSLAEGASEQAASLEETSSSLEEMASMTKRNSENAQKANELAKEARSAADKGVGDMQTMSSAMEAIKTSSDDIAKIIKTIDEIAFQTNILALNAAVEAARAGEAGMGFAVVAEEVRNLAQRSALAAKETAGKIEGAITKTGQGVEISSKVAETLNQIVAKVRQVDELVAEVAGASREQTQGISQINTAVGQMDKVTQSNAANAEESAAAAEELDAQASTMKQSVIELLQLVGGSSHGPVVSKAVPAARSNGSRLSTSPAKRAATPRSNGNGNGNGHAHPAPAMASLSNGRKEIPLEGDFKDF